MPWKRGILSYYPSGKLSNHIRMAIGRKEEMEMMKEMIRNIAHCRIVDLLFNI